jgi:hypothetical protein
MTAVIVVIAVVVVVVVALVVAPRMGGSQVGRLGRSRRPLAGDDVRERPVRRGGRQPSERTLFAEGEEIQQRVEAQVARDRASTEHRFRLNGRAEASRLAPQGNPPVAPGYEIGEPGYADPRYRDPRMGDPGYRDPRVADPGYRDPRVADPGYGDPAYRDPRHVPPVDEFGRPVPPVNEFGRPVPPVDEFGRPLVGRSRVEEDSAEAELRQAAARAQAARFASASPEPRAAYGRRRLWPPRPRHGPSPPPPPVDGRDDRFVP